MKIQLHNIKPYSNLLHVLLNHCGHLLAVFVPRIGDDGEFNRVSIRVIQDVPIEAKSILLQTAQCALRIVRIRLEGLVKPKEICGRTRHSRRADMTDKYKATTYA